MLKSLQRILYLEDDPLIAELALMSLQDLGGLTVRHCFSGAEAIDAAADFAPHLLLFDVMLPDMDGPQTFGHISGLPACAGVPVIFMTAKAQTHQEQGYLDLGACGVIVKPFDPLALPDKVRALWSAARDARDGPRSATGAARATGGVNRSDRSSPDARSGRRSRRRSRQLLRRLGQPPSVQTTRIWPNSIANGAARCSPQSAA